MCIRLVVRYSIHDLLPSSGSSWTRRVIVHMLGAVAESLRLVSLHEQIGGSLAFINVITAW